MKPIINNCFTLNSLSLFRLAESVQWIFGIGARDVITADYATIMSRTLKVTSNHLMYDRGAWFLRVIISSSLAFVLLALSEEAKTWLYNFFRSMYNKTIIRFGFCDIQINRGLGKGYQAQPSASADSPYLDLDYSGYHKKPHPIIVYYSTSAR